MFGINGKPIHCIEKFFDPQIFATLHREVVRGLCLVETEASEGREYTYGNADTPLFDPRFKDVGIAEEEMTDEDRKFMESLCLGRRDKFKLMAYGAYYPWCIFYSLEYRQIK